jgi:hypothetical protein
LLIQPELFLGTGARGICSHQRSEATARLKKGYWREEVE